MQLVRLNGPSEVIMSANFSHKKCPTDHIKLVFVKANKHVVLSNLKPGHLVCFLIPVLLHLSGKLALL